MLKIINFIYKIYLTYLVKGDFLWILILLKWEALALEDKSQYPQELGLEEGSKVVFTVKNNAVIMKKVTAASFDELAIPFTDAKKKIREDEVTDLIHKLRREKKI